jgi:hypothetical protein
VGVKIKILNYPNPTMSLSPEMLDVLENGTPLEQYCMIRDATLKNLHFHTNGSVPTPFHIACVSNRIDIVRWMLKNKKDIDVNVLWDSRSPLELCIQHWEAELWHRMRRDLLDYIPLIHLLVDHGVHKPRTWGAAFDEVMRIMDAYTIRRERARAVQRVLVGAGTKRRTLLGRDLMGLLAHYVWVLK